MSGETLSVTVRRVSIAVFSISLLLIPSIVFAQSPWERAASNLERTFTGPLARSLALVAIVIGGLMFMFGEGGAKRQISGIVLAVGSRSLPVSFCFGCSEVPGLRKEP